MIFEQAEVFHSRYVLVILDSASSPHALRACFGLARWRRRPASRTKAARLDQLVLPARRRLLDHLSLHFRQLG